MIDHQRDPPITKRKLIAGILANGALVPSHPHASHSAMFPSESVTDWSTSEGAFQVSS